MIKQPNSVNKDCSKPDGTYYRDQLFAILFLNLMGVEASQSKDRSLKKIESLHIETRE